MSQTLLALVKEPVVVEADLVASHTPRARAPLG
jgi:hypothetical protein